MIPGVSGDWLLALESGTGHQTGLGEKLHGPSFTFGKLDRLPDLAPNDVAHQAVGACVGVLHRALVAVDAENRFDRLQQVGHGSEMASIVHVGHLKKGV